MEQQHPATPIMILAARETAEQWGDLIATPNRAISLYGSHSDLLYQLNHRQPALVIIDDASAGCSAELLAARIGRSSGAAPPVTLVIAEASRVATVAIDPDCGPIDYLPANSDPSMIRAKVAFLLRVQRQQLLFYSTLRELDKRNQQHQQLLEFAADGIIGLDSRGLILFANSAAGDLLHCDSNDLLGRSFNALLQPDWEQDAINSDREETRFTGVDKETQFYRTGGEAFPVACRPGSVMGGVDVASVVLFEDISARKEIEAALRRRAEQDPLTGLANRAAFQEFLQGALARARRSEKQIGLLYLDLNGFKQINDEFGHGAGDQILSEVARRLVCSVRSGDQIARLGGDEFVVVLDDIAGPQGGQVVAQTIDRALRAPHPVNGVSIHCPASIGLATFPNDGGNEAELLAAADQAMYAQKNRRTQQVA